MDYREVGTGYRGASSRRARRSSTSRRAAAAESASRRATSCGGELARDSARISACRSAAGRARSCAQTAAAVIGACRAAWTAMPAPGAGSAHGDALPLDGHAD